MTITDIERSSSLVDTAATVGAEIAAFAAAHDRDGTFVEEGVAALRDVGLLAMGVPAELGGGGGSIRDITAVQRELAHHCGSTALATSMHQHVVAFTAWRYRRDLPGAEATLRRVAEEGILLVSTGGADQTHPRGEATKVDGGYVVSGRKVFCSQSVAGTVMSTMFAYDDPEQGRRVLNMAVPLASEGVTVLDDWDTLGMRGTASNSIVLNDVFVPDERVLADRPHGVIDGPLQVIFSIAFPIISGVYLGVAEAAFEAAVDAAARKANDPIVQRQVGLMRHRLQVASWALDGALEEVGDDPTPSMERVAAVMAAKREIAQAGAARRSTKAPSSSAPTATSGPPSSTR
jgi:alkylation response protein AidB-like acyl-CoA dehydrogenase